MNTKAFGETIHDVASSIANSKWAKNVIPGKSGFADEISEFINSNAKVKTKLHAKEIDNLIPSNIETFAQSLKNNGADINIDGDKAKEIARVMHGSDYSTESFEKLNEALQKEGIAKEQASALTGVIEQNTKDVLSKQLSIEDIKGLKQKIPTYTKAYFSNPDKHIRNTRIGTAVGGYAALTVGGRYLSGGTLTTDSYGRGDIAGIPFL